MSMGSCTVDSSSPADGPISCNAGIGKRSLLQHRRSGRIDGDCLSSSERRKFEIESADDFVLTGGETAITRATFTGLLSVGATVGEVVVESYQVFPDLSNRCRR
jgi:hypothetical protein